MADSRRVVYVDKLSFYDERILRDQRLLTYVDLLAFKILCFILIDALLIITGRHSETIIVCTCLKKETLNY